METINERDCKDYRVDSIITTVFRFCKVLESSSYIKLVLLNHCLHVILKQQFFTNCKRYRLQSSNKLQSSNQTSQDSFLKNPVSTNHLTFPPITFSRMAVLLSLEAVAILMRERATLTHRQVSRDSEASLPPISKTQ